MKESAIYSIENMINGKFYIGSSKKIAIRKNAHFTKLKKGVHANRHLQRSYNLYGSDVFIFNILEYCDIADLLPIEQLWLDEFFNESDCYNMCPIAGAPSLGKGGFSDETITGMRNRMLDLNINPMSRQESRDKIGNAKRLFSDEINVQICKSFLNGESLSDLAKLYSCSRRGIETAIYREIDKHITGPLTLPENKMKLSCKRDLYHFHKFEQLYEDYMNSDLSISGVVSKYNIGRTRVHNIIGWFEFGNHLYNLKPDPDYEAKKLAKDNRMNTLYRKYDDSFYLKLLNEYETEGVSIASLCRKYNCHKSWIKTARRLIE